MAFIYNLTDSWNDVTTTWNGIKLAVTNTSSDASSKLLNLTVSGATTASFVVDKSGNLELNGSVNKVTITAPATAATFTLADNSTFATVGGYATTFTFSGATSLTFPTSGTVTALGNTTTGTGSIVLANDPTITLTNATGLPIGGITGFGTGVAAALGVNVGSAGAPVLFDGALGTPSSGTLTNCTGYVAGNLSGLGANVGAWLATPSSANLAAAVTDETGSGSLVFGTSPTIGSPTINGSATFNGASSGAVEVKAPAVAGSTTFQLPAGNGSSGYVLVTDGLGNTSWAASGGAVGSAAGLNKNIQFNDSGAMAGNSAFNFDKTTYTASIGIASTTSGKFALYNSASADAVTIASGNNAAAWTMTLPTTAGTNGYAMVTDGSGNMSWSAIAAGTINTGVIGQITYYSGTNALSGTTTGTGVLTALGINVGTTGAFVAQDGALGTPSSGTLTNATGLPISTGVSGLGTGVATFLATPSSANLASAVTDETGTGALVFANTPTLVTPILGTPTSGTLTNCTGLPISTGVSGLGSNVATFLATPSSANLASAVTDETGTGALVFGTTPTLSNPTITNYVETYYNIGTVTSTVTLNLANGTFQNLTLTSATALTVTMPTATAGKSFILMVRQPGAGTATTVTFTGVKWSGGTAPTITATLSRADFLAFFSDGTNWYGSAVQNYTP